MPYLSDLLPDTGTGAVEVPGFWVGTVPLLLPPGVTLGAGVATGVVSPLPLKSFCLIGLTDKTIPKTRIITNIIATGETFPLISLYYNIS